MKGFKFLLVALLGLFISVAFSPPADAQAFNHVDTRIVKKSLAVGKSTSQAAPQNVWIQVADTGSARASILLSGTDTSKITGTKLPGMVMYDRAAATIRVYNGIRWKRVTLTD